MKYEEILIVDHKIYYERKIDLYRKVTNIARAIYKLSLIKKKLDKNNWRCLCSKYWQYVSLYKKCQDKLRKISPLYWENEKNLQRIEDTLFKYYEKQIEDKIKALGIEKVDNIASLMGWESIGESHYGTIFKDFEREEPGV